MNRFQFFLAVTVSLFLAGPPGPALAAPGDTELISANAGNGQAAGFSGFGNLAFSSDGRLVGFMSSATTLVPNDTDSSQYVFVRDRVTGTNERTIKSSDEFAMSADGRFIVVAVGPTVQETGIYVYDRQTGKTERVDVSSTGQVANKMSLEPAISANGRYVAFVSEATNLVPNNNHWGGVFVRDRQTGTTTKVDRSSSGEQANGPSEGTPSISADGRYVVFDTEASNLVPGDTNGMFTVDVFVRDRQLGKTERVSVDSAGGQGDRASNQGAISADGRYVCFWSDATNLIPDDNNFRNDIFVHDRVTGQTVRASVTSNGSDANGDSFECALSADGRYVAFSSNADNLAASDSNTNTDVFWHDMLSGKTERASVASNGAQANGFSRYPAISGDGLSVVFYSAANNLTANDHNKTDDVYLHEPGGPGGGPETVGYTLRPRAMDFGSIPLSRFSIRNFFLKNTGNVPLSVASVELLGPNRSQFAMASHCGSSVAVATTCTIRIEFRPTSVGKKVAQLKVIAGGKPARMRSITGTGQ